jgi:hypothetical protein
MKIELQVISDCPHSANAYALLRQALDDVGLSDDSITTTVITDDEHAQQAGFHGSPSFAVDGRDLFDRPDAVPSWSCRLYLTDTGLAPLPEFSQLRSRLAEAAEAERPATSAG